MDEMDECMTCAEAIIFHDTRSHPPSDILRGCLRIEFLGLTNDEANPLNACEYWRKRSGKA